MNNVVTINRGKFLSSYSKTQKVRRFPEQVYLLGGVILWVVLPKLVYVEYGGPVSLTMFSTLTFAAIVLGVTIYRYLPPKPLSILDKDTRQSPNTLHPTQKKAA